MASFRVPVFVGLQDSRVNIATLSRSATGGLQVTHPVNALI
uniref:Uncharacterized protein n=1 Tax=Anguilla anguilla TaxID=7936 RepID=A0A0E9T2W1_ANGAN